jgi:inhibitor of cysteine peptidase
MAQVSLSLRDDGRRVRATVGDFLEIRLPESPTTGYRWQVRTAPPLSLESDNYSSSPGGGTGGGGERVFRFRVTGPGSARIEAANRRAWESSEPPLAHFGVDVDVGQ